MQIALSFDHNSCKFAELVESCRIVIQLQLVSRKGHKKVPVIYTMWPTHARFFARHKSGQFWYNSRFPFHVAFIPK
jgi:hypothetical protein